MPQGKMKVKAKLPSSVKQKTKTKGGAISKRNNAPVQSKKKGEAQIIKKMISKNVNKAAEEEIRSLAIAKKTYSKAQLATIAHNTKQPPKT